MDADLNPIWLDALANEIRRVDGNHSLGAGALAEAIAPFIAANCRPEIPEAEDVPLPAHWGVMEKISFRSGWTQARNVALGAQRPGA